MEVVMKYFKNNQEVSSRKFYGSLKKDIPDRLELLLSKKVLKEGEEITAGADNDMNVYKLEV